jgi:hypothetical protein
MMWRVAQRMMLATSSDSAYIDCAAIITKEFLKLGGAMADDLEIKREIVLEADTETLERMRKEGHARGFTVFCDEGERIGGDNTAPPPLAYFGLSVGF